MLLGDLTEISNRVAAVSARKEKTRILAGAVETMNDDELAVGVSYLSGIVPQGSFGIGYASLRSLPDPADVHTLTLSAVDDAFATIAATVGAGSAAKRQEAIDRLFSAATEGEQRFLFALLVEGLRQGANASLMMDAVAKAAAIPVAVVRRAVMFTGDVGAVASVARTGGEMPLPASASGFSDRCSPCLPSRPPT